MAKRSGVFKILLCVIKIFPFQKRRFSLTFSCCQVDPIEKCKTLTIVTLFTVYSSKQFKKRSENVNKSVLRQPSCAHTVPFYLELWVIVIAQINLFCHSSSFVLMLNTRSVNHIVL